MRLVSSGVNGISFQYLFLVVTYRIIQRVSKFFSVCCRLPLNAICIENFWEKFSKHMKRSLNSPSSTKSFYCEARNWLGGVQSRTENTKYWNHGITLWWTKWTTRQLNVKLNYQHINAKWRVFPLKMFYLSKKKRPKKLMDLQSVLENIPKST